MEDDKTAAESVVGSARGGPRWFRHLPLVLMSLAIQTAATSPLPTETQFAACVTRATPAPWKVLSTRVYEGVPSIELEARSADLGIKHRDIDARQQRFLALSLTPFRKYTVFRPERLEEFLVDGLVKRVDSARGVPSNELKEFDIYLYGKQALLMNPRRTHVCLDKATGVDWPNPFIRCESVIDGYAARFEVSAEALVQLSAVLRLVDQLTLRLTPCMNSARNMNHG